MAFVILANPTAGIFQGDRQTIAVTLEPEARAHVTNQSATKVHRMPDSFAVQDTSLTIGESAHLEYLPEPVIPFKGARIRQETNISVASSGALLYGEIIAPGRVAFGENLDYESFQNCLTVSRPEGELLYREAYRLEPRVCPPWSPVVLGLADTPTLGFLLIVTAAVKAQVLQAHLQEGGVVEGTTMGITTLPRDCGVGIKVIGPEMQGVKSTLTALASKARQLLTGFGLPASRKY